MTCRIILASKSPARLRLLQDAGIFPEVIVSGADETIDPLIDPDFATVELARRKASAVAGDISGPLVLGCDSMLYFGGRTHGKPGTASAARAAWLSRRGKSGVLWTGHVLIDSATGREVVEAVPTTVHFAAVSEAEINAYVSSGEPLWVAGAFTLDGRGAPFVERIEGDHSNVVGLSLPALRRMLHTFGFSITEFWQ